MYLYCVYTSMMFGSEKFVAHFCAAKRPPSVFLSSNVIVRQSALKKGFVGIH